MLLMVLHHPNEFQIVKSIILVGDVNIAAVPGSVEKSSRGMMMKYKSMFKEYDCPT
jgi:hypothetical protein